ncbi:MAG: ATP-dependent DNA helicase, partial [Lachnospiraceae bacterium]|nr:ATP-dependent DNA helicase [Lachnospiraceae bacterium]
KPGNYMAFFPSHAFLAKVYEQFAGSFMDEDTTDCIVQEEYMNEEMRENFLAYFSCKEPDPESGISGPVRTRRGEPLKRTLIGFCVLGGIFSEGIDLKNDSLIGAIVVGTGLPMVCNERELLKDFFDDENSDGFDYAYRYPGMNKVLQAAGRVIRTAEDVGIVALLDERFLYNQNNRLFPREWEDIRVINAGNVSDEIRGFWDGHS